MNLRPISDNTEGRGTGRGASRTEDRELMAALRGGDRDALTDLYNRHAPLMTGLACKILGDPETAQEVVHEVFLYAWRRPASYDPRRASVTTWLTMITRSRAIDRLRNRQARARLAAGVRKENPSPAAPPRAGDRLLDSQRRRRMRQALAKLPKEQREVLRLAYYQGLSQREIADAADLPLGTVKSRVFLAMKKLRRELGGERDDLI